MKVGFDISSLGQSHIVPEGKTGIPRVVEHLFEGLRKSSDVDLSVSALGSMHGVAALLETMPSPRPRFMHESSEQMLAGMNGWVDFLFQSALVGRAPIPTRLRLALGLVPTGSIRARFLQQLDIFHSPLYPLPGYLKAYGNLQKFITIYDLIAVTQTRFMTRGLQRLMKNIMASITPDTWVQCISEHTRRDLLEYLPRLDPKRIFVTPLAADKSLFYPCLDHEKSEVVRQKYKVGAGPYVLSICTLEPRKNLQLLLRVFIALKESCSCPDLKLILAGGKGWMIDKLFADVKNAGNHLPDIIITGYIPDAELAVLYSNALVFVYMSLYEGFGLPPLEAMQCGVPVITSNVSSLPEVVADAGLALDPHDHDGLAQAMLEVYRSEEKQRILRKRSLERAALFSWDKTMDLTVAAYHRSLQTA